LIIPSISVHLLSSLSLNSALIKKGKGSLEQAGGVKTRDDLDLIYSMQLRKNPAENNQRNRTKPSTAMV
jgi:hypothetical protein